MAGGDHHPPRPPQEDVEKLPPPFCKSSLAKASSTLIGSLEIILPPENTPFDDMADDRLSMVSASLSSHQGRPTVTFNQSEKDSLIKVLNHVLVAKFSHGRPALEAIKKFFFSQNLQGDIKVTVYDSKHIIVECGKFADFVQIWIKKVWIIKGFTARIFKWDENFHPTIESSISPIWIHLPCLPIYFYDEWALLKIASAIGRPLFVDKNNINRKKLGYATICVEIDVAKPTIDQIWFRFVRKGTTVSTDGFWQEVRYDFIPNHCSFCHHLGHKIEDCKRLVEQGQGSVKHGKDKGIGIPKKEIDCCHVTGSAQGTPGLDKGNRGEAHKSYSAAHKEEVLVEDLSLEEGELVGTLEEGELGAGSHTGMADRGIGYHRTVVEGNEGLLHSFAVGDHRDNDDANVKAKTPAAGAQNTQFHSNSWAVLVEKEDQADFDDSSGKSDQKMGHQQHALTCRGNENVTVEKGRLQYEGMLAFKTTFDTLRDEEVDCAEKVAAAGYRVEALSSSESPTSLRNAGASSAVDGTRGTARLVAEKQEYPGVLLVAGTTAEQLNLVLLSRTDAEKVKSAPEIGGATEEAPAAACVAACADLAVATAAAAEREATAAAASGTVRQTREDMEGVAAESADTPQDQLDARVQGIQGVARQNSAGGQIARITNNAIEHAKHSAVAEEEKSGVEAAVQDAKEPETETIMQQLRRINREAKAKRSAEKKAKKAEEKAIKSALKLLSKQKDKGSDAGLIQDSSFAINTPRQLSSAAAEFTPNCASVLVDIGAGRNTVQTNLLAGERKSAGYKDSRAVLVEEEVDVGSVEEKSATAGGQVVMITNNDMEQLKERMNRLRGNSVSAAPSLAASTWAPINMSKHLARELKKTRKQLRINQNWQDIEDYSDEESDEGDLEEKAGSQRMNGNAFLTDEMGDIPRPFKIKSAPNSPKGRNSSYDSSTYLLSRGLF